jgi:D-ribulokinase
VSDSLLIGLDLGTSGARVCVITPEGALRSEGRAQMADFGNNIRDPYVWWKAASAALYQALSSIDPRTIVAIAIDGTSGTMLPIDKKGKPLALGRMYNDPCEDQATLKRIQSIAPTQSAAHGPTSGLAKAILFQTIPGVAAVIHQADWIAGQFSGTFVSDKNNALKTGYDPLSGTWPDWMQETGVQMNLLPRVFSAGDIVGPVTKDIANTFGFSTDMIVVAGTTDGCASFLATGASETGDGVSALGTTLTLKILSDGPIFSPEFGVYSHKVLGKWLTGGASNTGGNVLLAYFNADEIARLSAQIDPDSPCDLDYYPLVKPGERFPFADPALSPVLEPRPESDIDFFKGMLDGIAHIEQAGFDRMHKLGGPKLRTLRTVGGGADNQAWTRMRKNLLDVPFLPVASKEAAYGTALLALHGIERAK